MTSSWSSSAALGDYITLSPLVRVTALPTLMGQYRSRVRGAASVTYSDTTATSAPNWNDGFRIYNASYLAGGNTGEPNRYDIFIGNKVPYLCEFYASPTRTGGIDTQITTGTLLSSASGLLKSYDASTGVLSIESYINTGLLTAAVGLLAGLTGTQANCYFDVRL